MTVGGKENTHNLVKHAQKLSKKGNYDQVWCVFDKDEYPELQFNNAIKLAEKLGFGVAYSNQAFEYWLILHFVDHQGSALHRNRYAEKLNQFLNPLGCYFDASGSKIVTSDIFDQLMAKDPKTMVARVDIAIQRAERI